MFHCSIWNNGIWNSPSMMNIIKSVGDDNILSLSIIEFKTRKGGSNMAKIKIDDDFQSYLVEGASFVGEPGIPMLMDTNDACIPKKLISFPKCKYSVDRKQYVHFYVYDYQFSKILTETKKYIELLRTFDGVITPDPSIIIGGPRCLQETNVYFNRAVGFFLQRKGITIIPNVRWGDPSTYSFCFLGIPKGSIVSISTLGAIKKNTFNCNCLRTYFKLGLDEMLKVINPKAVIVYGYMPKDIFGPYEIKYKFIRYPSQIELAHQKKEE